MKYEKPDIMLVLFETQDVITSSYDPLDKGKEDGSGDIDFSVGL